ncbi:MAG: ion transporter [Acidobacteriota bacterium]
MPTSIKAHVFRLLEPEEGDVGIERFLNVAILVLIVLNVFAVVLGTVDSVESRFRAFLSGFEVFSVAVFSLEYLIRLWSCTSVDEYSRSVLGRLRFAATPIALVDLLAILPFYIPWILPVDLRFMRSLRLLRLFRLLKLARYSNAQRILRKVLWNKKEELLVTGMMGALLLLFASSLMYFIERDAQPKAFGSIPSAMWWGVVTLTTVGYGDIYPVTPLGKFVGAFIEILGVGMFALPAGILASGFAEEIQGLRRPRTCPQCGKVLE